MFLKYFWLLVLVTIFYVLYAHEYYKRINQIFDHVFPGLGNGIFSKNVDTGLRTFTSNELKRYTNLENGLYISILGEVYDVTKGAKHYGPGETYHAFTGRDASLAFVTGEFTPSGLTDDVSSLSTRQIKMLDDWAQFYKKNYVYKGKLAGRYYYEDGNPTPEFYKVKQKLSRAVEEKSEEERWKIMFPPCNVEWNRETGTRIWCSKRSGGIQRDWVGVPRMLFETPGSERHRCACVALDSAEYRERKGALREYIGCAKNSAECFINADKS